MTEQVHEQRGGRPRKGALYVRKDGGNWWVKFTWRDRESGKIIRRNYPLDTRDRRLANLRRAELSKKLERNGELPNPVEPEAKPVLRFQGAAAEILEKSKIGTIADRIRRVSKWAYPLIGNMPLNEIMPRDISRVLEACRDDGRAKQSVQHLKADLSSLFRKFEHEQWVPFGHGDVVRKTPLPEDLKVDDRARSVLTDDELYVYMAFRHPIPKFDRAVLERQTMVTVARLYGGLRTSEILRMTYEDLEEGRVRRSKTNRKERLEVPDMLWAVLERWSVETGRNSGLVFPVLQGADKGEARGKNSFAFALRRDIARAFGLETWDRETNKFKPVDREMTKRERELLVGDDWVKPVDFHSGRRGFTQALVNSGVDRDLRKGLSSHDDDEVLAGYNRTGKPLTFPAEALPALPLLPAARPAILPANAEDPEDDPDPGDPPGVKLGSARLNAELPQKQVLSLVSPGSGTEPHELASNTLRGVPQPGRGPALGAWVAGANGDGPERKSSEIFADSFPLMMGPDELREPLSGTELGTKPAEKSSLAQTGLKPRGHRGDTSVDTEDRERRYQTTLAHGLAEAFERGDFALADTYEQALTRLLGRGM